MAAGERSPAESRGGAADRVSSRPSPVELPERYVPPLLSHLADGAPVAASRQSHPGAPAFGLSNSHISPRYRLEVARGGSFLALGRSGCSLGSRPGRRGRVAHFSRRSRSRLFKLCCKTKRAAMMRAIFVTLTYPASWPESATAWKRQLDSWWKRVVRKYPHAAAVWRLEFQERGAPHYHLILLNVPFLPHQQTARWWAEVVGDPTGRLRAAGTETRRVKKYRQVVAYASKYVAKEAAWCPLDAPGRFWGVLGRQYLPMELAHVPLDAPTWFALLDIADSLLPHDGAQERGPPVAGLWLVCEERAAWLMLGQAQRLAGPTVP